MAGTMADGSAAGNVTVAVAEPSGGGARNDGQRPRARSAQEAPPFLRSGCAGSAVAGRRPSPGRGFLRLARPVLSVGAKENDHYATTTELGALGIRNDGRGAPGVRERQAG